MSLTPDLELRDATPDDLSTIAALRDDVGWGSQEWALRAVIGQADARCVLAVTTDGSVAGVGSGIVYGPMGFVGNMITATDHRRRGIGSAILEAVTEFLEGAGCVRLELNATSDGRPLYERHGFRSVGTASRLTCRERAPWLHTLVSACAEPQRPTSTPSSPTTCPASAGIDDASWG